MKYSYIQKAFFFLPIVHVVAFQPVTGGLRVSTLKLKATSFASGASSQMKQTQTVEKIGKVAFLLPDNSKEEASKFGGRSPCENPSILEATEQLCRKVEWFSDDKVDANIYKVGEIVHDATRKRELLEADALVALNFGNDQDIESVKEIFSSRKLVSSEKKMCQFALGCSSEIPVLVSTFDQENPSLSATLFPWSNDASAKRMVEQMSTLFDNWTSDDFTFALMLFFNQYSGTSVDWVKHSIDATWEKGPIRNAKELYSMVTNCGDCVAKCVADEKCKECLDALTAVDTRDQVASYRTVVSYESELLRDFSFCILQKNNIFGCSAKIPTFPKVNPTKSWRGKALTKEAARSILIGHLDENGAPEGGKRTDISWKVAAGANVAYDQFPSQNQIFYESVNGKSMWYDPVFRVETIDGRNVWCKRHYRVRDGKVPGTFRFSVLDNGVTSDEFWNIVAVAEDLSWIVFHYAGAAGAVGQSYLGGLLCTPDGSLPPKSVLEGEIYSHLRSAGIEPWELFVVDNNSNSPGAIDAGEPPLDYFRKNILLEKAKAA